MKLLAVHPGVDFSTADVHDGLVAAFRTLGVTVEEFNLNDRLAFYRSIVREDGSKLDGDDQILFASLGIESACFRFKPDVLLVTQATYVPDRVWHAVHAAGIKTVCLFTESPYEDDWQLGLVNRVEPSYVFLNDPSHLTDFRDGKRKVYYLPHAYNPTIHYPAATRPVHDFVFVGTGFRSRIDLFESVDWDGIDARFAGNWRRLTDTSPLRRFLVDDPLSCSPNEQTADLYRSAKVSANLYRGNDKSEASRPDLQAGWAMGPREIELAACGTFFIRESRGEGDMLLPMLPTFTNPDELGDLIRWWSEHDRERTEAAAQARAALQHRTFTANAVRMLRLIT